MSLREYVRELASQKYAAEEQAAQLVRDTEEAKALFTRNSETITNAIQKVFTKNGFAAPMVSSVQSTIYESVDWDKKIEVSFTFDGKLLLHVRLDGEPLGQIEIWEASGELFYQASNHGNKVSDQTINIEQALDPLFKMPLELLKLN